MFVNRLCLIPYKSIVEDVMSRYGPADEKSFTPFNGLRDFVEELVPNINESVGFRGLVEMMPEYDVHKSRLNHTRLEDINNADIRWYIERSIKYDLDDKLRAFEQEHMQLTRTFTDEETGEVIPESETLVQASTNIMEIQKAKASLTYNMKMMHVGSIQYGGSILSFALSIAKAEADRQDDREAQLKAIVEYGVYRMKYDGSGIDLENPFVLADNTKDTFRNLIALIRGADPDDIYYKAYLDFISAVKSLDIDIIQEDIRDYANIDFRDFELDYIPINDVYYSYAKDIEPRLRKGLEPEFLMTSSIKSLTQSFRPGALEE